MHTTPEDCAVLELPIETHFVTVPSTMISAAVMPGITTLFHKLLNSGYHWESLGS